MVYYLLYTVAALYLGVLTSISPCPLATNIAAISYIGRKVENPRSGNQRRAALHTRPVHTVSRIGRFADGHGIVHPCRINFSAEIHAPNPRSDFPAIRYGTTLICGLSLPWD